MKASIVPYTTAVFARTIMNSVKTTGTIVFISSMNNFFVRIRKKRLCYNNKNSSEFKYSKRLLQVGDLLRHCSLPCSRRHSSPPIVRSIAMDMHPWYSSLRKASRKHGVNALVSELLQLVSQNKQHCCGQTACS